MNINEECYKGIKIFIDLYDSYIEATQKAIVETEKLGTPIENKNRAIQRLKEDIRLFANAKSRTEEFYEEAQRDDTPDL